MTELSARYRASHQVAQAAATLVCVYATSMVVAGDTVAKPLFDALGFGPHAKKLDPPG